jgi:hypothetical protein
VGEKFTYVAPKEFRYRRGYQAHFLHVTGGNLLSNLNPDLAHLILNSQFNQIGEKLHPVGFCGYIITCGK